MSALRVVLVTRRFWPLAGGAESATANLARGLLELGAAPLIVTARFDPRWPDEVVYREIPVHRLPFSPGRFGWGTMRYMIGLSRWLRKNHPDIDLVCVSRMSHESHAVLGAHGGANIPVVIRAEPDETFGVFQSRKTDRMTTRIVRPCQSSASVA